MNFRDLRAILQYVPQFRGSTFVVALDGAVIDSPDLSNILLDLAVLRSLNINVVLVHGASAQIAALGEKRGIALSNTDGSGPTDTPTLEVAIDAISRLSNGVMQSLTMAKIRAASANAIHARPVGTLSGEDMGATGTIERVDAEMLRSFLDQDILPVLSPLCYDAHGQTLRVSSDVVAREVALALGAEKIIFLSLEDPLALPELETRQLSQEKATTLADQIETEPSHAGLHSKLRQAIRASRDGIPRVHLIGCDHSDDALLAELFSNEGVGLMLFADDYHELRPATTADVDEIYSLIRRAVEDDQLLERTREQICADIGDFQVLAIDGNIVGCVAVHYYPKTRQAELACLFVKSGHKDMGYGAILVEAAHRIASTLDADLLFALSTQAVTFLEKNGFKRYDDLATLPEERLAKWQENQRNATLLIAE